MFRQLQNIDTAFRHIRLFSLVFLVACLALSAWSVWKSFELVKNTRAEIYILNNNQVLRARLSRREENIAVEARDHIRMFHHWFFTLDPDEEVIRAHMAKAFAMGDRSIKTAYDNLRERGYYSSLIAANVSQEIQVDSIRLEPGAPEQGFTCYARQKLVRSSSTLFRDLVTRGRLREVARSDQNPHGFLITQWATLQNNDIPQKK
ncbi:MAG: conjugative transposon protein TraK [Mucilaginibacter polytrichastri]|nr:conjugative transposon protein TraK [Mucilaginibacter polytrichastri]